MFKTVEWLDGKVRLLDQRALPAREDYIDYESYTEIASAIKDMVVRGAPAIGVTAAMGVVLGVRSVDTDDYDTFMARLDEVNETLAASRPTAVNLFWAIERMKKCARRQGDESVADIKARLEQEAITVYEEDLLINKTMGENGAELIEDGDTILTHCNAGALATAGNYGTALGVIKAAHLQGKKIDVLADETRPWLQGARLTCWELQKEGIPVKQICDNMAGALMAQGMIDKVIVGSDRIAANGDVTNKIGTYTVAVLADRHNIPFYAVAPMSTIDFDMPDGSGIVIEQRSPSEVTTVMGKQRIAPEGVLALNPAFDVTPSELVSAIVTEKGIATGNYSESLSAFR